MSQNSSMLPPASPTLFSQSPLRQEAKLSVEPAPVSGGEAAQKGNPNNIAEKEERPGVKIV